jgi:hypothetical protein
VLAPHNDIEANTALELGQVDWTKMHGPSAALGEMIRAAHSQAAQ